ncbi:MAG: hypothetical protein H6767_00420 [Candidatus Peribacteria bacterium]|nr:MAG: hypothetical protein H6767_00420 [Candidatus Peribacteria bacterium]
MLPIIETIHDEYSDTNVAFCEDNRRDNNTGTREIYRMFQRALFKKKWDDE